MMDTCDQLRIETLEMLQWLEPDLDAIMAQGKYFSKVDDKFTTNNYCEIVQAVTKDCEKLINPKLWYPLNSNIDTNTLVEELGFNWPKRAEENYRHIKNAFDEIEQSFQKKGVKPSTVPGVQTYQPKNNAPAKMDTFSQKNNNVDTALEEHNPILDDERLKNIDKKIAERILNEVVHKIQDTTWDDIAGLDNVKQAINEIVVYPMQNPELFRGLLAPAKGLLLFGPPGTGKTLIGRCIASESGATFFAISASSLTSKWIGEGEKMVRALFAVARCMQPSVVFIDEIDSLLTQRVDGEHDSSRRMKTEFLIQFDGVSTGADDRLLIVGATNRPQELDEAARRRFTKRLYIPLPEEPARKRIIQTLMAKGKSALSDDCIDLIVKKTEGYSGADMSTLCKEAALCTVRAIIRARGGAKNLGNDDLPPISLSDFDAALRLVKASVSDADLGIYEDWDKKFGATAEKSS